MDIFNSYFLIILINIFMVIAITNFDWKNSYLKELLSVVLIIPMIYFGYVLGATYIVDLLTTAILVAVLLILINLNTQQINILSIILISSVLLTTLLKIYMLAELLSILFILLLCITFIKKLV